MSYAPPSIRARGREHEFTANITPPAKQPLDYMARFNTCHDCPWNLNWTCQHTACKVCPGKQKEFGTEPLRSLLAEPFFHCPLKKF